jgi:uncharacterized UBP type Zn finger protein
LSILLTLFFLDTIMLTDQCSSMEETYRHISLDIVTEAASGDSDSSLSPPASIDQSLARFFKPEQLECKCEKCESTIVSKTMKVVQR